MTTITIKNGSLKKTNFNNTKDLFEFLMNTFTDKTILERTDTQDLNTEEIKAWKKHKADGYEDFSDFKG